MYLVELERDSGRMGCGTHVAQMSTCGRRRERLHGAARRWGRTKFSARVSHFTRELFEIHKINACTQMNTHIGIERIAVPDRGPARVGQPWRGHARLPTFNVALQ